MPFPTQLQRYKQAILSLPKDTVLTKGELLTEEFLVDRDGKLEMYYAPHNEYRTPSAAVAIVGLTPGWAQMRIAIQEARIGLEEGLPDAEICKRAKDAARFAGTMRSELIRMLDALELHHHLQIPSCESLFQEHQELLHSTALLRYPVFTDKNNYSGTRPELMSNEFLRNHALSSIREEMDIMNRALVIPLGKRVEEVLQLLVNEGKLKGVQCLWGFPHPSGANGHRHQQFAEHQEAMRGKIEAYF
ncbi:hypothetical protein [Paenibacillus sp. OAS669]|uniref:hypothetical protein n=1 Tax=Paenibacillus sp. OAS669 TaxID=2663821 RepID=UPI00178BAFC8|nr:hypothetical protein [Paenibacillus sp. OAS669]MBE1443774.1 hypothetical protein [Paenibacillus sp. OAS669]